MTTNPLNITLGVPAYGSFVHAGQIRMWAELGNTLGASPERFNLRGIAYADINGVDRARNFLLTMSFHTGTDWLLMIDADTWVEPITVGGTPIDAGFQLLRMISEADRRGAIIVGAPVARRGAPGEHEVMVYRRDGKSTKPDKLEPVSVEELGTGQHPVDALATAVFAVKVSAIGECRFKFTEDLSEDLDFCRQVRQKIEGWTPDPLDPEREIRTLEERAPAILVDTRVNTRHLSRPYAMAATRPT